MKPAASDKIALAFGFDTGQPTAVEIPVGGIAQRTYWQNVWRRVMRDPFTVACGLILILIAAAALFAPWLGLPDPTLTNSTNRLLPVGSPGHPLGTDELGRDMLSRLIHGGRLSLMMGIVPVLVALLIGGSLGLVAGFVGLIDPLASPYPWRPAETEVAEILEVPVRHLLDPLNLIAAEPRQVNGRLSPNETFLFREHRVFGATARALRNLLNIAFAEV